MLISIKNSYEALCSSDLHNRKTLKDIGTQQPNTLLVAWRIPKEKTLIHLGCPAESLRSVRLPQAGCFGWMGRR